MSKNKVRVKLNRSAVRELMKSPEMQDVLEEHASKIAARGKGKHKVYTARTRAVAEISKDNTGDNTLLRGMR